VHSASGIVLHHALLHVVADDRSALHRYRVDGSASGSVLLFRGDPPLPDDPKARKAAKPDLEALALLADGRLLALGSGSKAPRRRGAVITPATQSVREINATGLYDALDREFARLNIEGAVVWRDQLLLAQRSNGRAPGDALLLLDLRATLDDLARGVLTARALRKIVPVALGSLDGVPLGLTDLSVDRDGALHFVAAAEATDDPVDDAPVAGSVLGRLDEKFGIAWQARLRPDHKIEGLHWWKREGERDVWLMVADADDPLRPSPLLACHA
jgi:hypothetical protein